MHNSVFNKYLKFYLILLSSFIFLIISCQQRERQAENSISIIPKPVHLDIYSGTLALDEKINIVYTNEALAFSADYLKSILDKFTDNDVEAKYAPEAKGHSKALVLSIDNSIENSEGYHLEIDENVVIKGKMPEGVFYGIQTLSQIIFENNDLHLPKLKVDDYPKFPWRGMHLDVSRHFFDTAFVKKYIDLIALHKMNTFHWHLIDDQGWRLEIKKYPKLTEVGAWRVDREYLPWNERPAQKVGEEATYGGYYTQEEIKDIVQYARERHITIIPEIEMPAHVSSALAAYPEYSCKGTPITVPPGGVWPITDIYCAGNEETFRFLEDILTEVMELFPSKFIHVGGDEANKAEWEKCPKCQKRMREEGLKDEHELQSYFIQRMDKFLTRNGRRLIGWDEILEGGLAENAAVMSWRGEQGGIAAAKMNHDVVMTPVSHCYFDYYQSLDKEVEPLAFGGFTSMEKVYNYEPVPEELDSVSEKHILGAQGNLWTEYITTGSHAEYMVLPRMTALSEALWTENKDFDDFLVRLESFLNKLSYHGYNYHIPSPENMIPEMIFTDSLMISLEKPWPFGKIYYTLDGSTPSSGSIEYTEPISANKEGILKAIFVLNNGKSGLVKSTDLKKVTPLPALTVDAIPERQINYRAYEGAINTVKNIGSLKLKEAGLTDKIGIPPSVNSDYFALEMVGLINIPQEGIFTLKLISDDGSQLFIDDKLIVNADGLHGPEPSSGQVALKEGYHSIKVLYFEAGGGETLEAYISGPGMTEQMIPAEMLGH